MTTIIYYGSTINYYVFKKNWKGYKDIVTHTVVGANYSYTVGQVRKALNLGRLESRVARFNVSRFIPVFSGCWWY